MVGSRSTSFTEALCGWEEEKRGRPLGWAVVVVLEVNRKGREEV